MMNAFRGKMQMTMVVACATEPYGLVWRERGCCIEEMERVPMESPGDYDLRGWSWSDWRISCKGGCESGLFGGFSCSVGVYV